MRKMANKTDNHNTPYKHGAASWQESTRGHWIGLRGPFLKKIGPELILKDYLKIPGLRRG